MPLTRDQIRASALRYLENKRVSLWADWQIQFDGRREKAADWLTDQVLGVLALIEDTEGPVS